MRKLIDLTGQSFGKWTVVRRFNCRKRGVYWLCVCECGKEDILSSGTLRSGRNPSCGCQKVVAIEPERVSVGDWKKLTGSTPQNVAPIRFTRDYQDEVWGVFKEMPTEFGFSLLLGRKPRTDGTFGRGTAALIPTQELVDFLRTNRSRSSQASLPVGRNVLSQLRKSLQADTDSWWGKHAAELRQLNQTEFAKKYGLTPSGVSKAVKKLKAAGLI